ncbi:MAG: hypothetical protein IJ083_02145 [Clostridia bacterium]|nr:hypothetical protein [Clostridia bacterium]
MKDTLKSFGEKIRQGIMRFMQGRHGVDEMGMALLIGAIVLSLVGSITRLGLLTLLSMAAYIYCIYRLLSRNGAARQAENRRYLQISEKWKKEIKAFFLRMKMRKTYKYFRCPGCKARMRQKRGSGEKHITCPRCHHEFTMKA